MTVAFSEVAKKPKDLFLFHSEAAPFYKWVATFCGFATSQSFNIHLRVSSLSASGHLHGAVTALVSGFLLPFCRNNMGSGSKLGQ